jgi:lipoate-protein ligase A
VPPLVNETSTRWRLLYQSLDSVFQNLAIEEAIARCYAASSTPTSTIRLWVNPRSVVLGRFQELESEVDTGFSELKKIPLARRFTGGGAVYHDEGNLNFTLVSGRDGLGLVELHRSRLAILVNALLALGMEDLSASGNSIFVGERKVTGAAAAFGNGFALWHSSILVSTDIGLLEQVLAPSKRARETHFVRSRWHPVTTLQEALGKPVDVKEVETQLIKSIQETLNAKLVADQISPDEAAMSRKLYAEKYSRVEWNRNGQCKETEQTS